jgi:hypothetical protein
MTENTYEIRMKAIKEIKNNIKKNANYLHPCNKGWQEYMNRLGFANGNEFTCWMQQNEIMKNPSDIEREQHEKTRKNAGCKTRKEYETKCAQNLGFKDRAEERRERRHESGEGLAIDDKDSPTFFGKFTENLMIQTFENVITVRHNNPGFDWICKNGDKIENKSACLKDGNSRWTFNVKYNKIADWFIFSAWDNRDSLTPLYVWILHKNDMVRGRKVCEFEGLSILNNPSGLKDFEEYLTINRLERIKKLCNASNII